MVQQETTTIIQYKIKLDTDTMMRIEKLSSEIATIFFTSIQTGKQINVPTGFAIYTQTSDNQYPQIKATEVYAISMREDYRIVYGGEEVIEIRCSAIPEPIHLLYNKGMTTGWSIIDSSNE
jgi:hypothetical protein